MMDYTRYTFVLNGTEQRMLMNGLHEKAALKRVFFNWVKYSLYTSAS